MAFSFFASIAFISLHTPLITKEERSFLTENKSGKENIKPKEILISRDEENFIATSPSHFDLEKESPFIFFVSELGTWANFGKVQASINHLYDLEEKSLTNNSLSTKKYNPFNIFGASLIGWTNLGKIQVDTQQLPYLNLATISPEKLNQSTLYTGFSINISEIKKYNRFNVFAFSLGDWPRLASTHLVSISQRMPNTKNLDNTEIAPNVPYFILKKESLFISFFSKLVNQVNLGKVQASINQLHYLNEEDLNLDIGQLINKSGLRKHNWLTFFGSDLCGSKISLASYLNEKKLNGKASESQSSINSSEIKKYNLFNVFAVSLGNWTDLATTQLETITNNIEDMALNNEHINLNDTLISQKDEKSVATSVEKKSFFIDFVSRLGNWANFAQVQEFLNYYDLKEEKRLRFFRFELESWMNLGKIQISFVSYLNQEKVGETSSETETLTPKKYNLFNVFATSLKVWKSLEKIQIDTKQLPYLNLSNISQENLNSDNTELKSLAKLGRTNDAKNHLSYSETETFSKDHNNVKISENMEQVKENHFSLFGDVLYFKAIEDSIKYAEHIPQNQTFTPTVKSISQDFEYNPGFRVGVNGAFDHELWNVRATWMHYRARPQSKHASTTDFGLLATFAVPVWGSLGNSQVNKVKGNWNLLINAIDLDVRRMFNIKGFSITPIAGIKGGLIEQKVNIHYGEFLLDFPLLVPPRTIEGKISFWGVGPLLGIELGYLLNNQFKFFALGTISYLTGGIDTKTLYRDFSTQNILPPENSQVKIEDSKMTVSIFEQLQLGMDKRWIFKRWALELAIGWEVQIWGKQLKLNSMGTFITPPDSGDLSLYGPFLRAKIDF